MSYLPGHVLMHLDSQTIGLVARVLPPGEHVGLDGVPVDEAVVELQDGNRFLARDGAFMTLSQVEFDTTDQAQHELGMLLAGAGFLLKQGGVPQERALVLLRSVLTRQLRALGGGDAAG